MRTSPTPTQGAFTLLEVLFVLGTVLILAALLLPAMSKARVRPHGNCVSNLKQVGLAWLQWMNDHSSSEPPFRTPVAQQGTMGSNDPLRNNAWWQFSIISNEMNSPKVLACPADTKVGLPRRVANSWSATDTNGGFLTPGFRHLSTSYTIGLDATHPLDSADTDGSRRVLGSDRNILFDGRNASCTSGLSGTWFIKVRGSTDQKPPATASWTNAIHGLRGNVLTLDGAVQQATTQELNSLAESSNDNGSVHFLVPNR
jgi:hypothetical protein